MSAELTAMRWHELAIQNWLYSNFFVQEGYPVPVVFTSPMDAFSNFKQLWSIDHNPFSYLLDARDETGEPLYLPHPAPVRYPLISVHRKGWDVRSTQNYAMHRCRYLSWPTVSNGVAREDLGVVKTVRRPQGWNFKYQIDFFSMRPDTQAVFLSTLMSKFWMHGGSTPRCWVKVNFPSYLGVQFEQMLLDAGSVQNMTPEEVPDNEVTEYRFSFVVTLEGWVPDLDIVEYPAMWTLILNSKIPATPGLLEQTFEQTRWDTRVDGENPIMEERSNVPT